MIVATTRAELAAALDKLDGIRGLVPTMGALHEGHERLIETARHRSDQLVATIFVNPLQFGPTEDFDRYPRTLDRDLAICARNRVDVVFAPGREEMYPGGEPAVRVDPGPLGGILEGASRPGFFHGVLTVVLKLFHLTAPDLAFFGEKDYQQLTLVRHLVRDTDLPMEIVGVPTVREADGLAMSSRNRYLDEPSRRLALALSTALREGAEAGSHGREAVLPAARAAFHRVAAAAPDAVELDYLVLTDPDLGPAPARGPARLLVAARVGRPGGDKAPTRLIDNMPVELL